LGKLPALSVDSSPVFRLAYHLLITRALDYFDPASAFGGDLSAALAKIR
jgi:homoserine O-acetyltransferase